MSLCASCGLQLAGESNLCAHHHVGSEDDWASVNRIMCDFVHRGKAAPRLSPSERNDEPRATVAEAA